MDSVYGTNVELAEIDGQIADIFRALSNGFQKLDKIKYANRQSRQLEELTGKMRECKRLIKEYDRGVKESENENDADTNKILNEKKQSMVLYQQPSYCFSSVSYASLYEDEMIQQLACRNLSFLDLLQIKELNSYVALKKQYATNLENKRVDLFDAAAEGIGEDNGLLASSMTNEQLMDHGNQMMDETDQAIERSKKTVQDTLNVGTETAAALKAQTEQMSRVVNELDSIHFSIKKASKLVREIGRQVATDRCIMALLFLIVIGVIAIIIVKLVHPNNKDIADIPGLAPPVQSRKLLWDTR